MASSRLNKNDQRPTDTKLWAMDAMSGRLKRQAVWVRLGEPFQVFALLSGEGLSLTRKEFAARHPRPLTVTARTEYWNKRHGSDYRG